jgi:hypothetical protein
MLVGRVREGSPAGHWYLPPRLNRGASRAAEQWSFTDVCNSLRGLWVPASVDGTSYSKGNHRCLQQATFSPVLGL